MTATPDERERSPGPVRIPIPVLLLGAVSLLTDLSSEAIFAVLPLFVTGVLGVSVVFLGVMEGLADFASSSLDLASGAIADRTGRHKALVVTGYALSSASKLLLVLASSGGQVLAFRVVERFGKSIRGAPRDALLAGMAATPARGLAFGVHKAFDKGGAVLGPLAAWALLERLGQTPAAFRTLFTAALVPAFAAVALLVLGLRERRARPRKLPPIRHTLRALGPAYRSYLLAAGTFSLGYFSVSFLLLAAGRAGFDAAHVAQLYALSNASFVAASPVLGRVGDRLGRRSLVALSYALYACVALGFAAATSKPAVVALFAVYGVFFAIDEAQSRAFVVDLVPGELRALALGFHGFATGLLYLPASLVAGFLWQKLGPGAAFGFAAASSGVALLLLFGVRRDVSAAAP